MESVNRDWLSVAIKDFLSKDLSPGEINGLPGNGGCGIYHNDGSGCGFGSTRCGISNFWFGGYDGECNDGLMSGSPSGIGRGSGNGVGYDGATGGYSYVSRGIKSYCGQTTHRIDGIDTLIDRVHGSIAKGKIIDVDLTLKPCYVAKIDGCFAHGETVRETVNACQEKAFADMPTERRIDAFLETHEQGKSYPCSDLYKWHHRLTGSCEMGRNAFARTHGIDVEHDEMTIERFIDLTRDEYGGQVIRELENRLRKHGTSSSEHRPD